MNIVLIQKLPTLQGETLNEKFLAEYESPVVPMKGDVIFLSEEVVGEVKQRVFSKDEPSRVVLILDVEL